MAVSLRVQAAFFDALRVEGLKGSETDVERDIGHLRAARGTRSRISAGEVQTRGGRRDRTLLAREYGLVALAVGSLVGPLDVGRQGHVPDPLEFGEQVVRAREADGPLAELAARDDLCLQPVGEADALAARASCGPGGPAPPSRGRRATPGAAERPRLRRSGTRGRFGLFLPTGSDRSPVRWPNSRAGKTRESLRTRQSPGRRKDGNSRKVRSSQRPSSR